MRGSTLAKQIGVVLALLAVLTSSVGAQQGAVGGEWRFYAGDNGSAKYSPLDQINAHGAYLRW
jgi:hypothetical protein